MAWHDMSLNDAEHRILKAGDNLSADENYEVTIQTRIISSGEKVNFLIIKSNGKESLAGNTEIRCKSIKIPPDLPE